MHDPESELPPPGASVRLAEQVDRFPHFSVDAGERGRVVYDYDEDRPPRYGVDLDDPPPGSDAWQGVLWFEDRDEFLYTVEPADLGRDPEE